MFIVYIRRSKTYIGFNLFFEFKVPRNISIQCRQSSQPKALLTMVSFTVFKGSQDGSIVKSTTSREVRPDEVLVKVTHSGVCGTDEHHRHRDIVLGHEGTGTIEVGIPQA